MEIEIWFDIRCPFCYIAKQRFDKALSDFEHRGKVKVTLRSFELDPDLKSEAWLSTFDYLTEIKGNEKDKVKQLADSLRRIGVREGLELDLYKNVEANSFDALRLVHLAKTQGLEGEVEKMLFKAYFGEGQRIDDIDVLIRIGEKAGLQTKQLKELFSSTNYGKEVEADKERAAKKRIRKVPFFLFNNKTAVSGLQTPDIFLSIMERIWNEHPSGGIQLVYS